MNQEGDKNAREYFERGCLCIINKRLVKAPESLSDRTAVKYYEKNCNCSRNYKHLEKKDES